MDRDKILQDIFDSDPLGLLNVKLTNSPARNEDERLVASFQEINDFYEKNRPVLGKLVAAWAQANQQIVSKPDESAEMVQKAAYKEIELAEFRGQFKASKYYSNAEWRTRYQDGTATKWLQQVTDFFVANANIQGALKAEQYFDPSLFLETVKS